MEKKKGDYGKVRSVKRVHHLFVCFILFPHCLQHTILVQVQDNPFIITE